MKPNQTEIAHTVMTTCLERVLRYSVIIPTYNATGTIQDCLQALLDQSVSRDTYEVLVVDDGSTDGTAELAENYAVRVIRKKHAGPASARNFGADAALGEYLLFTDADCIPTHTWIEEIVRPLEADSEVAGAKGAYRTNQTSLVARLTQVELEGKYAKLRQRRYIDFIDTYSAAFRRDAFWEGGAFDPGFRMASNEDTQLSFNLAAMGKRLVFAEKAIVYHRHSESLGHYLTRKWRHGYWRVRVYQRHPKKIAGDSYTPRSTQVQLLATALTLALGIVPGLQIYALASLFLFILATLPFVGRAVSVGLDVALAVPVVLFLRSLALGAGLTVGTLSLLWSRRSGLPVHSVSKHSTASPRHRSDG